MNDERRTPKWLFELLDSKFHFTIDIAAARENALVIAYMTKEINALVQEWTDHVVWCNPPYSRGQLVQWVAKAATERAVTVMLLPADNSTKAGQLALKQATAILFLNCRLVFDDEKSGAKFASWIALFGGNRRDIMNLHLLNLGIVL